MKHIILVTLLLSLPYATQAKNNGSFGFVGGINGNFAENSTPAPLDIKLDPAMGFQFGMFYSYRFESFRLRILGQLKTFRVKQKQTGSNLQIYSLQYSTPILFQQMLTDNFGYFIGPEIAANLSTTSELNDVEIDLKFPSVVTSAMVGLTYKLTKKLYLDFYYSHGVTDVAENVLGQTIGLQFSAYFERQKKRY